CHFLHYGTYFGLHIEDSIANTRAIGAVMGGLLGCCATSPSAIFCIMGPISVCISKTPSPTPAPSAP
ncbi:hypothetical protein C0U41_29600, partial [Klebsiella pneumoniae]